MAKHGKRQKKRSRGCLGRLVLLLFLCAAGLWFFRYSNDTLQVTSAEFSSAQLPAAFDGCRIAVLSDLHGKEFGEGNADLGEALTALSPDYIFFTGDFVDRSTDEPLRYIAATGAMLSDIAPTYYVTGNHDWDCTCGIKELKQTLCDAGVTVLGNEYMTLTREGETILLAGIDDPNGYANQKSPEALAEEVSALSPDFWILLAHRNDRFREQYSLLGADLTVSGHAHGGLIRLPLLGGLFGNNGTFFPEDTEGFCEANGSTLLVSRGLGNSGHTFRLFNRPEIIDLTLKQEG